MKSCTVDVALIGHKFNLRDTFPCVMCKSDAWAVINLSKWSFNKRKWTEGSLGEWKEWSKVSIHPNAHSHWSGYVFQLTPQSTYSHQNYPPEKEPLASPATTCSTNSRIDKMFKCFTINSITIAILILLLSLLYSIFFL